MQTRASATASEVATPFWDAILACIQRPSHVSLTSSPRGCRLNKYYGHVSVLLSNKARSFNDTRTNTSATDSVSLRCGKERQKDYIHSFDNPRAMSPCGPQNNSAWSFILPNPTSFTLSFICILHTSTSIAPRAQSMKPNHVGCPHALTSLLKFRGYLPDRRHYSGTSFTVSIFISLK